MDACGVTVTDKDIGAGAFFEEEGKVFGAHFLAARTCDLVLSGDFLGGFDGKGCGRVVVDGRRVVVHIGELGLYAVGDGLSLGDFGQTSAHHRLHGFGETAHGAVDIGLVRNDVIGAAGVDLADRDDEIVERIARPAGDGLDGLGDRTGGDNRIAGVVMVGDMAADTVDMNVKGVYSGHDRAGCGVEFAQRQAG